MKILLLGYMGSGKSTIGKKVAAELGLKAMDLDHYIEERMGLSIPEIFKSKGEIFFRKAENQYLNELLENEDSFVLALGGGTPCYANNMDLIRSHSISIYLKGSLNTLLERLKKGKDSRPLIANLSEEKLTEFIAKHLFERRTFYEQADITMPIDQKSADQNAQILIRKIRYDYSK